MDDALLGEAALSAKAKVDERARAAEARMSFFIGKPFQNSERSSIFELPSQIYHDGKDVDRHPFGLSTSTYSRLFWQKAKLKWVKSSVSRGLRGVKGSP